jgi:hypothetical protein
MLAESSFSKPTHTNDILWEKIKTRDVTASHGGEATGDRNCNVIAHDIFREGKPSDKSVGTGIKLWEDRRGGQTKGGQQKSGSITIRLEHDRNPCYERLRFVVGRQLSTSSLEHGQGR